MYQRTLKDYKKAFDTEHTLALNAAYLLNCVYQETLKLESAEHFFRRATIAYTRSLGTEHSRTQDASRRLSYIRTLRLPSKRPPSPSAIQNYQAQIPIVKTPLNRPHLSPQYPLPCPKQR